MRRHDRSPNSILSLRELADLTGLSASTLARMRRSGDLPEPVRISAGRIGWRTVDIQKWLASRQRARQ